ncbi:hypothetical protein D9M71_599810 [compost metagenome]
MHQARHEGLRTALFKPAADGIHSTQRRRAGPAGELAVAIQLRLPARNLALEEALDPTQITETDLVQVDAPQRGSTIGQRQPHGMPDTRISSM